MIPKSCETIPLKKFKKISYFYLVNSLFRKSKDISQLVFQIRIRSDSGHFGRIRTFLVGSGSGTGRLGLDPDPGKTFYNQCCGSGSGRIRTILVGSVSFWSDLGLDPNVWDLILIQMPGTGSGSGSWP
jgi:hypothetical protein